MLYFARLWLRCMWNLYSISYASSILHTLLTWESKSCLIWSNRFQFSKIRLALGHFHHWPYEGVNFAFFDQWTFELVEIANYFSNAMILLNFEELQMIPNFPTWARTKVERPQLSHLSLVHYHDILEGQSTGGILPAVNKTVQHAYHQ